MTPEEYKKARGEYDGTRAAGGCGLAPLVFGLSAVFLGTIAAVILTVAFGIVATGLLGFAMQPRKDKSHDA